MKDYYKILGLQREATEKEIRKAYIFLLLKYQLDENRDNPTSATKYNELNEAFQTLSDESKRINYDLLNPSAGKTVKESSLALGTTTLIRYEAQTKALPITRYTFEDAHRNSRYIDSARKLNDEDKFLLQERLLHFPHSDSACWSKSFIEFEIQKYPRDFLTMAANAYDVQGNTMLGIACEFGESVDAVQKLIDIGAELDTPDHNMNKLALHWAISNKLTCKNKNSPAALAVVQCLLKNGARTDIACYKKTLPVDYAKSRGFTAAAKLIEDWQVPKNKYGKK